MRDAAFQAALNPAASVSYDGKTVAYRSYDDLLRAYMLATDGGVPGAGASTRVGRYSLARQVGKGFRYGALPCRCR